MRPSRFVAAAVAASATLLAMVPTGAGAALLAPTVPVTTAVACDPLDTAACLLPFPSDFFTKADTTTATGKLINFGIDAMPRTGAETTEGGEGKPVDPTEWNRNDGFSPGSAVMTYVPGIDLPATWGIQDRLHSDVGINEPGYFDYRDQITDIALYQAPDAPIVIINAATGERHPFWSEIDQHAGAVGGEQVLMLRPAVNFTEGTRYIVALRHLKTSTGTEIPAGDAFTALRNGISTDARQAHFNTNVFPALASAGIDKEYLYLAWDFTVASERNLAERILHMRNDAFGRILGDTDLSDRKIEGNSPTFVIDGTTERADIWTDSRGASHTQQIRRVEGRITVPNYLDRIQQTEGHVKKNEKDPVAGELYYDAPVPGSRLLDTNLDGLPDQNPVESTVQVPFMCDVVLSRDGVDMGKQIPGLYGHGLLGDRGQLRDLVKSPIRSGSFMGCAADFWGMSTPDLPTVAATLTDISHFPSLPDRAQQGFLNFMYLGRALVHPQGFAANAAFQRDGVSLIDTADNGQPSKLFYDGNSQGGIMGGPIVALSPDVHRAILGVTGMNYSTLLNRSVDWEGELDPASIDPTDPESAIPAYSVPYYENYRDPIERQIGFQLLQMLWDRGEANGFAAHMTEHPYADTPKHEVMLQVAFSDHQVTNHAAEVEARTIGAPLMAGLAPGRHWALTPFIDIAQYPYEGSALIYWDSGNATPPNGNLPPSHGGDPHGHPRDERASSWQEAHFLMTGVMVDVCGGGYYFTNRNPVNNGTASCLEPTVAPGYEI